MTRLIAALFLCIPAAAQADFALSDMVGSWSGSGFYYEKPSRAKLQCRLTMTGDDAKVTLSGRCGSTLASETMLLDFVRDGTRRVVVQSPPGEQNADSDIGQLVGQIQGDMLIVAGQSAEESVKMQFEKKPDGTLHFVTERVWEANSGQSSVYLERR